MNRQQISAQVVDFKTGETVSNPRERRGSRRFDRRETLFVQLAAAANSEAERHTLKCQSVDLSRTGLRVTLLEALAVGTFIEAWIKISGATHTFYLVGHVRWCEIMPQGVEVGIALSDGPGTDFKTWRRTNFAVRACQPA